MVQQESLTLQDLEKACVTGWDQVRGVVLFGSRARNEAAPGADWDLGIVFAGDEEPEFNVSADWDLFLWSESRWEDGFALQVEIAKDGNILLDPEGKLAERFEKIREYILPHWAGYLKKLG
ncbi:MAG TPA: hypothetical protein DEA96_10890 [Leptospiraceae bacterium]|nr:hypothetical protein [Spirochaetaceae bacterium]HBS05464.1 hypothetical protein [Leptospiraceae bacterium]|tara:strand:+ start:190715 stop:191077 length:363 start_codon:yes stop_codon:yes gene_type:complete